MIYVTIRQKIKEKQLSWLDLLEDNIELSDFVSDGSAGTITKKMDHATPELMSKIDVDGMINTLKRFNDAHEELFKADRKSLYKHFCIPKKTGGLRDIDAPCDELKIALEELGMILTEKFGVLQHTAAFAYVKKRSCPQAVRKHQVNSSNWFYKTDVSGFFPSTTLDFTMRMVGMIFPLSEICRVKEGFRQLRKALSLAFLNGALPQGTPLSPKLTNIIAIPIDHQIFNVLAKRRFVYTRYADDIHISCVQKFDPEKMTTFIQKTFDYFNAPWVLKPEKTHFGSRAGHNFMLGLCLNKDNNITTGWRAKRDFKAMTNALILDYKHNKRWSPEDVQKYTGLLSYYKMVEKDYFEELVGNFNNKYSVNLKNILKELTSN